MDPVCCASFQFQSSIFQKSSSSPSSSSPPSPSPPHSPSSPFSSPNEQLSKYSTNCNIATRRWFKINFTKLLLLILFNLIINRCSIDCRVTKIDNNSSSFSYYTLTYPPPSSSLSTISPPSLHHPSNIPQLPSTSIREKWSNTSKEVASHERLKRALKEESLQDALKTFLEEWESHHSSSSSPSSSLHLPELANDHHHHYIANSLADPATASVTSHHHDQSSSSSSSSQAKADVIISNESMHRSDDDSGTDGKQRYNCSSCMLREEARLRRLQDIQMDILNKLGLKQAPNVTHQPSIPAIPPLRDVLKQYQTDDSMGSGMFDGDEMMFGDQPMSDIVEDYDGNSESYLMDTSKAISLAQKPPESWTFMKGIRSHFFKFSSNVINSHISKAHLWTYIKPKHYDRHHDPRYLNATIVVYEVRRSRTRDSPTLLSVRSEKKMIDAEKGSWVIMDIRKAVYDWFRNSGHDFSLVIHSYDTRGRELHVLGPYDQDDESQNSFVELSLKTKRSHRNRREIGLRCEEGSKEANCCLHPLTVDFTQFGWDWIIAPKRYEANFCSGECPFMYMTETNHATLVQQASPVSSGPCCSPRKMSSMSILYNDGNNQIIYGTLKGMKAERCGCS
ncbi:growth/differentiation factor 8-like [Brevipalpus obovatus]|uniref:growth/differentiation factor 8-like n=1 Tax=Brevipalpus obovatus TaxID=246614 RepID=UPI003D9E4A90